jgi:hypothetical protein
MVQGIRPGIHARRSARLTMLGRIVKATRFTHAHAFVRLTTPGGGFVRSTVEWNHPWCDAPARASMRVRSFA